MQPGHFRQIHSSLYIPISIRSIAPPFFDWLLQPGSYSRVFLALTARLLQPFFWLLQPGSYSPFLWLLQPGSYSLFLALTARLLQPFFLALTARLLQPFFAFFGSYSQALTARLLQPFFFGSYSQPLTGFCIAVPAVPDIHPVRLRNASKPPLKLDYLS